MYIEYRVKQGTVYWRIQIRYEPNGEWRDNDDRRYTNQSSAERALAKLQEGKDV